MPRNRSEQDTSVTLPVPPVLEDVPYFITKMIRMDARSGLGPGESTEGDEFYSSLTMDEQAIYEEYQCEDPGLDDYCKQWVDWYTKLDAVIDGYVEAHAAKSK